MDELVTLMAAKLNIDPKWAWFICGAVAMFIVGKVFRAGNSRSDSPVPPTAHHAQINSAASHSKFHRTAAGSSARAQASGLSDETTARVLALIATNDKINAIKLVRQETGLGLAEAKSIIDSLG